MSPGQWDFSEFNHARGSDAAAPSPAPADPVSSAAFDSQGFGAYASAPVAVDGFGGPASASSTPSLSTARPPFGMLLLAVGTSLLAIIASLLIGQGSALTLVGWLLAGPLAFGLLATFSAKDAKARAMPVYVEPTWASAAYWSAVVVTFVGVVLAAVHVASWVGHL